MLKNIIISSLLILSSSLYATYTYEANQNLIDLTSQSGTTNLAASDDGVSSAFNIGFTFDFYGQAFTQARMATNGCLHFKTSGAYCNDYTPDPLTGQHTYTLYPFWTDLIRDSGSKVLAKSFSDKTVFGWYDLREYNRSGSNNSIEVILWTNDTFDFRYGALDIDNHDVLIGEIGSGTSEIYQYLFHDECSTGSTNVSGTCTSTDWNNSSSNTLLESGGSLYGLGSGNAIDCSNVLNNSSCVGYAAAYLTQQCNLDSLYNTSCPLYWDAYDDLQCDLDSQYAPFCAGYTQEDSVAYYVEEDYGYTEEDMWYDEEYDEWLDPNDPCYENNCVDFTDADWYELDVEQFGQETVDEWFGSDVQFSNDGFVEWDTTTLTSYDDVDILMDTWDIEQEQFYQEEILLEQFTFQETFLVEDYSEPETFIEFETIGELDEWLEEEMEHVQEMDEIRELAESEEELFEEEEIFEEEVVEEIYEALEEEWVATEEEIHNEELLQEDEEVFVSIEREEREGSSMTRERALNVVANTIRTAQNSVSGTNSGNSIHATGNTVASGNSSSSTGGGISTTSSPSRSDQFASASVQTNTVLSLSSGTVSNVSISVTPMPTLDDSPQIVMADVQVQDMQGQIDTAISGVMTTSEADQVADKIIAQNIEAQQEEAEVQQQKTGEYADSSTLIAYLGYVAGFDAYRNAQLPPQSTWYESKVIYTNILGDNIQAFYGLAGASLNKLSEMRDLQPDL